MHMIPNYASILYILMDKCQLVRQTCSWVVSHSQHVSINQEKVELLASKYQPREFNSEFFKINTQQPELGLLQIFMVNPMNFCFWPIANFEYQQLIAHIQAITNSGITLEQLAKISEEQLVSRVFQGVKISQAEERARILREVATAVQSFFEGSFVKLVQRAGKSAVSLVDILTQYFPNLQDHSIYKGRQIHFYKRSQILIKDIYKKFKGEGVGQFKDIDQLTMFPDYRVPQVLQAEGVLQYSQYLKDIVMNKQEITDRELQAQLRASIVVATQKLKEILSVRGVKALSIQIDLFLWLRGEEILSNLPPHHRCLTIYY